MQITRHTDYSLRTLMYLAALPKGEQGNVTEIAECYGISRNHLVKVVHNLGRLNYIITRRGRGGGITLGKPAEEINLGELLRATELNMNPIDCGSLECPLSKGCKLYDILDEAVKAYISVLDKYTLKDVMRNRATLSQLKLIIQ